MLNRCYIKGYVSYEKEVQLKLTILIVVTEKITRTNCQLFLFAESRISLILKHNTNILIKNMCKISYCVTQ